MPDHTDEMADREELPRENSQYGILDRFSLFLWSLVIGDAVSAKFSFEPVQRQKKTTIYDLNDYVLRHIFDYLDETDLCSVADVCSNFKQNAQAVFHTRFMWRSFIIGINRTENSGTDQLVGIREFRLRQVPALMRNFASLVYSMTIDLDESVQKYSLKIIELIIRYASESLYFIWLSRFVLHNETIEVMRPLLPELRALFMAKCMFRPEFDASKMLSLCSELVVLKISSITNLNMEALNFRFHAALPKLTSFYIEDCIGTKNKSIVKFLKVNPQIQILSIEGCKKITGRIIPSIVEYNRQVEEFTFTGNVLSTDFHEKAEQLIQLPALKALSLYGRRMHVAPVVCKLARKQYPLEYLSLCVWNLDRHLVKSIGDLKTLKVLCLRHGPSVTASDIVGIVSNLPELTEIGILVNELPVSDLVPIIRNAPKLCRLKFSCLKDPFMIDDDLYMQMLAAAATREEKGRLDLVFADYPQGHIGIHVSEHLLMANAHFLKMFLQ